MTDSIRLYIHSGLPANLIARTDDDRWFILSPPEAIMWATRRTIDPSTYLERLEPAPISSTGPLARLSDLPRIVGPAEHLFFRVAEALWGSRWQSAAAASLGISDRHIRRIVAGTATVPAGVIRELREMVQQRQAELAALENELQ